MGKDLKGKELGKGLRQKKNGVYTARYTDRRGNRHELYGKNLDELKRRLAAAIYDDKNGIGLVKSNIKVSEWFETWMTDYKYDVTRDTTKMIYKTLFTKQIEPELGKVQLSDVTNLDIKRLIRKLDEQGYRYETKNKVRIILTDMFDKAVLNKIIADNPCRGIKVVRNEEKDIRVLTREEQKEFFDCCKGTFYDNLFNVAVTTGLRQGELCALTWDDIDLEKREIRVTKTLIYQKLGDDTKKEFHIHPPKTKKSNRIVPINKQCELALKKQYLQRNIVMAKKSAKPLKGYENLLFTTKFGTPICDQTMIDAIERIVNEINLLRDEAEQFEKFSTHCFRHTFATRCFESGMQPRTVQDYLGHAALDMTMNLYTSVLKEYKEVEMQKLENTLDIVLDDDEEVIERKFKQSI